MNIIGHLDEEDNDRKVRHNERDRTRLEINATSLIRILLRDFYTGKLPVTYARIYLNSDLEDAKVGEYCGVGGQGVYLSLRNGGVVNFTVTAQTPYDLETSDTSDDV